MHEPVPFRCVGRCGAHEQLYQLECPIGHVGSEPLTVKMLYQDILNRLADDFADEPGDHGIRLTPEQKKKIKGNANDNIAIKEQRIEEWAWKLGVELIVVDEIQRLVTKSKVERLHATDSASFLTADAEEVSTKLQTLLDRGIVPIVFIGDENSPVFFDLNHYFAARLGRPLKLLPLDPNSKRDLKRFNDFCTGYDEELRRQNVIPVPTCLSQPQILGALLIASGGHIGRAARIIEVALPAALERGAVTMEAYDLSNAVRDYAMGLGWVDHDPFSVQVEREGPAERDDSGAAA
jgi:hypothetical protein